MTRDDARQESFDSLRYRQASDAGESEAECCGYCGRAECSCREDEAGERAEWEGMW